MPVSHLPTWDYPNFGNAVAKVGSYLRHGNHPTRAHTAERPPKRTSQVHGNLTSSPLSCESAAFFEFLAFRCTYLFSSAFFFSTQPVLLCEYSFSDSFSLSLPFSFSEGKKKKKHNLLSILRFALHPRACLFPNETNLVRSHHSRLFTSHHV